MARISLPFGDDALELRIPSERLLGVYSPRTVQVCEDPAAEIRRALGSPIGGERLGVAVRGSRRVVILADDLTRATPVERIIPELLSELHQAGIRDSQVRVVIALGTHRPMTEAEILARFGPEVLGRVPVINHPWQDREQLLDFGTTPNGTPIEVCREVFDADFVIGVGSVVPHHICGYSGGAKIVQPGVTGAATTAATHLLSTRCGETLLGRVENPVRAEMEMIAGRLGLSAILNCVLDSRGALVRAFFGESKAAFRAAAEQSRAVYGVEVPALADVVVAGSHPCDIEFWQAHKSLYPAQLAVRRGGVIVLATPCPEGVAVTHPELLEYAGLPLPQLQLLVDSGQVRDGVAGALALAWARVRSHASVYLVSDGISDHEARALGFEPFAAVEEALNAAMKVDGTDARVTVLTHAPEMLPLVST